MAAMSSVFLSRLLLARYQQYTDAAQIGPVIAIDIDEWVGWQARE